MKFLRITLGYLRINMDNLNHMKLFQKNSQQDPVQQNSLAWTLSLFKGAKPCGASPCTVRDA